MGEKKRQDDSKRKRHNSVLLRLSDEEFEQLECAVSKSGMNRNDFLIKLIQDTKIIIIPDLQDICIELKRQGVNLNQALRFAYQYGDNVELMKAIEKCNALYDLAKNLCLSTENNVNRVRKRK